MPFLRIPEYQGAGEMMEYVMMQQDKRLTHLPMESHGYRSWRQVAERPGEDIGRRQDGDYGAMHDCLRL